MVMQNMAMQNPVPLLTVDSTGRLIIETGAVSYLLAVQDPITVISTVGAYRKGKSYLMNQLAGKHEGFPVGDTVQGETKGVWMWLLRHPIREHEYMLLLDSEGQGDVDGNDDRSVKIYILLIMLSGSLLINCTNAIDNEIMNLLEMVGRIAESLVIDGSENNFPDLQAMFPTLHFIIRDFHLKMNLNKKPCTNADYLEHCVKRNPSRSKRFQQQNQQRDSLKHMFLRRHLHTLPPPVFTNHDINIEDRQNTEFRSQLKTLCRMLHQEKPKLLRGIPIMAEHLVLLIKHCVEAFDQGRIPSLQVTFDTFARHQSAQGERNAVQKYDDDMKNVCALLPLSETELKKEHDRARQRACKLFSDDYSMFDQDSTVLSKIQNELDRKLTTHIRTNENKGTLYCRQALNKLYDSIVKPKIQAGKYKTVDGAEKYIKDYGIIETMYRELPQQAPDVSVTQAWEDFNEEHRVEGVMIQQASWVEEHQHHVATQDLLYKLHLEDRDAETDRMHTLNTILENQQEEHVEQITSLRLDLEGELERNRRLLDQQTLSEVEREELLRQNNQLEMSLRKVKDSPGCAIL